MTKSIPGFEGIYAASSDGHIISYQYSQPRRLRLNKKNSGYFQVGLYSKPFQRKNYLVHRLIALTFLSNPNNLPCINHKNSDRTDNRVENLEWCTYRENNVHGYTHRNRSDVRNMPRGQKHTKAKLSNRNVRNIRKLSRHGLSNVALAHQYGVDQSAIWQMRPDKRHLETSHLKSTCMHTTLSLPKG